MARMSKKFKNNAQSQTPANPQEQSDAERVRKSGPKTRSTSAASPPGLPVSPTNRTPRNVPKEPLQPQRPVQPQQPTQRPNILDASSRKKPSFARSAKKLVVKAANKAKKIFGILTGRSKKKRAGI